DSKRAGDAAEPGPQVGGTLPYMAPEALEALQRRVPVADLHADVFSLGVVLYELLTGEWPFPTRGLPMPELIEQMRRDRLQGPTDPRRAHRAPSPAAAS